MRIITKIILILFITCGISWGQPIPQCREPIKILTGQHERKAIICDSGFVSFYDTTNDKFICCFEGKYLNVPEKIYHIPYGSHEKFEEIMNIIAKINQIIEYLEENQ